MDTATQYRRDRIQVKRQIRLERLVPKGAMIIGIDLSAEDMVWFMLRPDTDEFIGPWRDVRTEAGVEHLVRQVKMICERVGNAERVFAMEPTGGYWLPVVEELIRLGERYVLVDSVCVARARELDDGRRQSADPKDARLIADLARRRKVLFLQVQDQPEWRIAWAEYSTEYYDLSEKARAERCRIRAWLDMVRPGFLRMISDITGPTALAVLQVLPEVRCGCDERGFIDAVKRVYRGKRFCVSMVRRLWSEVSDPSRWGSERYRRGLDWRIAQAAGRLSVLEEQIECTREQMLAEYERSPEAEVIDTIANNPRAITACVLGLAGDLRRFDSPRSLVKYAGDDPVFSQSGAWRGETHVSCRGRHRLRGAAYRAAQWLCGRGRNPLYRARYRFLRTRTQNRLTHREALVACSNTYLRMLAVMVQRHLTYEEYCHFHHVSDPDCVTRGGQNREQR